MNNLNLQLPSDGFLPGQTLSGEMTWELDRDDASIEISMTWLTRGKGTTDTKTIPLHRIERVDRSGKQTVAFSLPIGPCSFSGRLITLSWTIEARVTGEQTWWKREIVLSPTLKELLLD